MKKVRIYRPCKTAMQSGSNNTKFWFLSYVENNPTRSISEVTGWTSSDNTKTQTKLKFNSKEDAIKYAASQNLEYVVQDPNLATSKKKSYSENFTK